MPRKAEQLPPGTKRELLRILLGRELAAHDLAARLGVSLPAVRQHLATLQALGLVARRRVVKPPNRPIYLYRLSPEGQRAFPKQHALLLVELADVWVERYGTEGIADLVRAAARRIAGRVRDRFQRAEVRTRWALLLEWLEAELAWQATTVDEADGGYRVTILTCPFQDVSRGRYPAICGVFFATLIQTLYLEVAVGHVLATVEPACCFLEVGPPSSSAGVPPSASRPAPRPG
jgi:predicted ArsR family transcriptional regulator